ncbi:hypothetical protein EJ05DRAFT_499088 [Pseudovirgaria hyperparasitica]|uniref:Uncharacterized protein n=1 Tax=Pseudovirgaria hyperparasitica TaxID=470096 RepID=A0A6A6WDG1_9PEZI|nr:uncharacterized protein EJ05DRAFT_499088 [Pseudovirgaria hyperparasitica]KAF2759896.1 hypothetical protein EJ05DRAFT_499088 [Pseudovirgaria hyperparasitica]
MQASPKAPVPNEPKKITEPMSAKRSASSNDLRGEQQAVRFKFDEDEQAVGEKLSCQSAINQRHDKQEPIDTEILITMPANTESIIPTPTNLSTNLINTNPNVKKDTTILALDLARMKNTSQEFGSYITRTTSNQYINVPGVGRAVKKGSSFFETSSTQPPRKMVCFLEIPAEIRVSVYEFVLGPLHEGFHIPSRFIDTFNSRKPRCRDFNILRVCRQIYKEAIHIFWKNTVCLSGHLNQTDLTTRFTRPALACITYIRVHVDIDIVLEHGLRRNGAPFLDLGLLPTLKQIAVVVYKWSFQMPWLALEASEEAVKLKWLMLDLLRTVPSSVNLAFEAPGVNGLVRNPVMIDTEGAPHHFYDPAYLEELCDFYRAVKSGLMDNERAMPEVRVLPRINRVRITLL